MTNYVRKNRVYREVEYHFSDEDNQLFPNLSRLVLQGYNFVILQRCPNPLLPHQVFYLLACEVICSNGTALLHRHEHLTPEFNRLSELEHFVRYNMMAILHRHFFGRDLEVVN
jgi:hypothetical protein